MGLQSKKFYCQSIEDSLPVSDQYFDIVTAVGVVEFIEPLDSFVPSYMPEEFQSNIDNNADLPHHRIDYIAVFVRKLESVV